jgi:hypothetical protein
MSVSTSVNFRMKANNNEGSDFELPHAGTHAAALVALVDLGTTESHFEAGKKRHRVYLAWELTAEADSQGFNFVVGQDYTWSLNNKATLRSIVDGFRGQVLGNDEEYDLQLMLGKPCMISLADSLTGQNKKFSEVMSITTPPRGLTVPPPTRPIYVFHWGAIHSSKDDFEVPDWIPRIYGRTMTDELKLSDEYQNLPAF